MSNNESFIDEVNEDVQRDQMMALVRRYGWIAALGVFGLVGGAAYVEFSRSQADSAAQAVGDSLLDALEQDTPDAQIEALAQIQASGEAQALVDLLVASQYAQNDKDDEAVVLLNGLAQSEDVAPIYRQIAQFKALLAQAETLSAQDRIAAFQELAAPGAPLRLLAAEQIALVQLDAGQLDDAISGLQAILEDAETSRGLRTRSENLLTAIGAGPQENDDAQSGASETDG